MPGYRRSGARPPGRTPSGRASETALQPPPEEQPQPRDRAAERSRELEQGRAAPRALPGRRIETTRRSRLAELCADFFSLVIQLRHAKQLPEPAALAARLGTLFEHLKARAAEEHLASSDVDQARYALAALVDETLFHSPLPLKDQWIAQPLQLKYFGENTAGEGFFTRLDELRRTSASKEVLEVFYLCLALGFEGRYRMAPGGELGARMEALRQDLQSGRGGAPSRGVLAPHGERPDAGAGERRQLPLIAMAGVAAALAALLWILFSSLAAHDAQEAGARMGERAAIGRGATP